LDSRDGTKQRTKREGEQKGIPCLLESKDYCFNQKILLEKLWPNSAVLEIGGSRSPAAYASTCGLILLVEKDF